MGRGPNRQNWLEFLLPLEDELRSSQHSMTAGRFSFGRSGIQGKCLGNCYRIFKGPWVRSCPYYRKRKRREWGGDYSTRTRGIYHSCFSGLDRLLHVTFSLDEHTFQFLHGHCRVVVIACCARSRSSNSCTRVGCVMFSAHLACLP